jgi:hypothetical protein
VICSWVFADMLWGEGNARFQFAPSGTKNRGDHTTPSSSRFRIIALWFSSISVLYFVAKSMFFSFRAFVTFVQILAKNQHQTKTKLKTNLVLSNSSFDIRTVFLTGEAFLVLKRMAFFPITISVEYTTSGSFIS